MSKNNKKTYFNQLLYENLHSLCINSEESEIIRQNATKDEKEVKILYEERIESLFDNGLNINNNIFDKDRYTLPITMIEDLTIAANNAKALSIVYQNINPDFFQSLPYSEKKSIAHHLMSKEFFSDGEKEYLLSSLYDKGFYLEQEEENSLDISWLDYGYIEGFRLLFLLQKDFNFDFKYKYQNGKYDFTSIIENKILNIKNKPSDILDIENTPNGKIKQLEYILDCAHQLIFHQTLTETVEENIPSKPSDEDSNFQEENSDYKL